MKILLWFTLFVFMTACSSLKTTPESVDFKGIKFVYFRATSEAAIQRAQYLVDTLLQNDPAVREKMMKSGFKVEIIGKDQVLSDLPDFSYLKNKKTFDGRNYDEGTRGVGDTERCSIGEENLLCLPKQPYRQEDILVHEFAHSIKFNLDEFTSQKIDQAFQNAVDLGLYPKHVYMMANSQEYWAEGVQAWFGVTARKDVNGGYNTQEALTNHDPNLAKILKNIFGSSLIKPVRDCIY